MEIRNNERGGTLVMVLLLVAVFTILGMGLLSMNISASKQFDKKEEQVQARHLAEMGVIHYQAKIDDIVKDIKFKRKYNQDGNYLEKESKREYKQAVCNAANIGILNSEGLETGDYLVVRSDGEKENIRCENIQSDTDNLIIYINSKGEVSKTSGTSKVIDAEITLASSEMKDDDGGSKENQPPIGDGAEKYNNFEVKKGQHLIKPNSVHITGDLDIESGGGKNTSSLSVGKDLYIEGEMQFNNHACIVVNRNLTVLGNVDIKNKNNTIIVVFGDAHFGGNLNSKSNEVIYVKGKITGTDQSKLPSFDSLPIDYKSKCGITDESEMGNIEWRVQSEVKPTYN